MAVAIEIRQTGRVYRPGEEAGLDKLANSAGVPGIERNADTYSGIGMKGWWDPRNGVHGGLHLMNLHRGGFVVGVLESHKVPKEAPILDIGCGGGILTEYVARAGYNVTGVDLSKGAIEVAKEHALQSDLRINYQVGNVYGLRFPDRSFQAIVCSDFLEHVPDLETAISEVGRVLVPGGLFIFDTISRDKETVRQYMIREADGRIPVGTHDPKLFVNPGELIAVAKEHRLKISGHTCQTLEDFNDEFVLRDIPTGSAAVGHYLGYGTRVG